MSDRLEAQNERADLGATATGKLQAELFEHYENRRTEGHDPNDGDKNNGRHPIERPRPQRPWERPERPYRPEDHESIKDKIQDCLPKIELPKCEAPQPPTPGKGFKGCDAEFKPNDDLLPKLDLREQRPS